MNDNSSPLSTMEARFAGQTRLRHELSSALSGIIGYGEMLRDEAREKGDNEFLGEFKNLHRSGQKLFNGMNGVLEASKLETGTVEFSVEGLVAKLRRQLSKPLADFMAECSRLLMLSEEVERGNYALDLRKMLLEAGKLQAILESQGLSTEKSVGVSAVASLLRKARAKAGTEDSARFETGTVLVVDDNENNLDILSRQLHKDGHTVFAVRNGPLALQILKSRKIEIVLLGVLLPEMNGYQVLETLKADPQWREIPVIMISTLDSLDGVVKCLEMGAEDYLAKPFNPTLLKARINACLEKKRLRDQDRAHAEQLRLEKEKQDELFKELAAANWEMAQIMEELKATQGQLVVQEKLASLGALTAGIAHEIRNPLNFINNFSALSKDLADELKDEIGGLREKLGDREYEYVAEMLSDLKQNAEKILEHGNRADSIVQSMLLHSRGESGEWRQAGLNQLISEYLNLAYHGMRAEDASFNATLETDYDESIGQFKMVPQDLGRVFLNLFNNSFYAINEKKSALGGEYSPTVSVATRNLTDGPHDRAEIRIRDNGAGIPGEALQKIFNPFFTTKPPGKGTGLGLSISHEIIVQLHNGAIEATTQEGEFTEFVITIPKSF